MKIQRNREIFLKSRILAWLASDIQASVPSSKHVSSSDDDPEHKGFLESPRRLRIFAVEFVAPAHTTQRQPREKDEDPKDSLNF